MRSESNSEIKEDLLSEHEKDLNKPEAPQEERKIPPSPFFSLFKYTTAGERFKLFLGTISSLIAGAALPFFLLFFADITTIFDERYRDQSASKGWELCYKFFIVGGVTWVGSNHFIIQPFSEHTTGTWSDQPKPSGLKRNTSRLYLTNR